MTNKIAITLTPDEQRDLLMARIERSLRESGVTLSDRTRVRIADCLATPGAVEVVSGNGSPRPSVPPTLTPAAIKDLRNRTKAYADNRTRVYHPTPKAKPVARPDSINDQVLNLILKNEYCTRHDLEQSTKRPRKIIYTALWHLKKGGLIDTERLADLLDTYETP